MIYATVHRPVNLLQPPASKFSQAGCVIHYAKPFETSNTLCQPFRISPSRPQVTEGQATSGLDITGKEEGGKKKTDRQAEGEWQTFFFFLIERMFDMI